MPESCEATVTLTGDLHARPAGALALAAARFQSSVELVAGPARADAKSVLAVMGLGVASGQQVTVRAAGPDAAAAVAAIIEILAGASRVGGLPGPAADVGQERKADVAAARPIAAWPRKP